MISIADAYEKWKKEEKDFYQSLLECDYSENFIYLLFEGIYLSVKERT